jgi:hypothetical protein
MKIDPFFYATNRSGGINTCKQIKGELRGSK